MRKMWERGGERGSMAISLSWQPAQQRLGVAENGRSGEGGGEGGRASRAELGNDAQRREREGGRDAPRLLRVPRSLLCSSDPALPLELQI